MHTLLRISTAALVASTGCAATTDDTDTNAAALEQIAKLGPDLIRVPSSTSQLGLPRTCPAFTPDGRETNPKEHPFQSPILFGCGVDSQHTGYGLVTGDTGSLAIIPGNREIGTFQAFDLSLLRDPPTAASITGADGGFAQVRAWAAPDNVNDPVEPLPELGDSVNFFNTTNRIPIQVVAAGPAGVLLSFGNFDATRLQVSFVYNWARTADGDRFGTFVTRFYVNGAPDIAHSPPPGR